MIKFEVCKCIRPFNEFFEVNQLYVVHTSKNGEMTAYISPTQGFSIVPGGLVNTNVSFYKIYFETIAETYLRNNKEVKTMKNKSIPEILTILCNPHK